MKIILMLLIAATAFSFEVCQVDRVIDGDTIMVILNGEKEYVRFLGVDAPESVHPTKPIQPGALEASAFTKQLTGREIILTFDENKRDFFGRLLAYIWVESDNGEIISWNVELIKKGHSKLYKKYKFQGVDWMREAVKDGS